MQLQKSFKSEYTDELKYKVRNRQNLADYALETFPLENPQTMSLRGIPHPEGLLEQLIPEQKADFKNAITLYEAYPTLTPLIASDESFWAYLTHVDLFPFVQKRWSGVKEQDTNENYVLDHWFMNRGRFRNALSSLWWCVYMTIDENRNDKYELTKVLYSNADLLMNLTASTLFRHKEATFGLLEFYFEHPEICDSAISPRNRYVMHYFNRLGGVKQLVYMDRSFFKKELERNLGNLMRVKTMEDVSNITNLKWD